MRRRELDLSVILLERGQWAGQDVEGGDNIKGDIRDLGLKRT